jgi:hypothetical protein
MPEQLLFFRFLNQVPRIFQVLVGFTCGTEYISAVSKKLTPFQVHNPFVHVLCILLTKVIVPKHILLTFISVLGRVVYFIFTLKLKIIKA